MVNSLSPKKTQKTKPLKKLPQTDAIFENVFCAKQVSDDNPHSLRLSINTKAKVKIGNLSRECKARTLKANQADDHDTEWQSVLVPFGILNTQHDQLSIYLGQSAETSDFIVDCLTTWWHEHQRDYRATNNRRSTGVLLVVRIRQWFFMQSLVSMPKRSL